MDGSAGLLVTGWLKRAAGYGADGSRAADHGADGPRAIGSWVAEKGRRLRGGWMTESMDLEMLVSGRHNCQDGRLWDWW